MAKKRPRQYSYILNSYLDVRLSKCPRCRRLTHRRKFALMISIEGWGPLALGKTCVYCSPCELIMVHQQELEAEIAYAFAKLAPKAIGNKYLVMGTVPMKLWKEGLKGIGPSGGTTFDDLIEFKKVLTLEYEPGGWVYDPSPRKK